MEDEPPLQPADSRWMTQFHELQQQQVVALIQQNENQKAQLAILAMQLQLEKQRRQLPDDHVGAKLGEHEDIAIQQLLPSPVQDAPPPVQTQDFEMSSFISEGVQSFGQRYNTFGVETPQQNRTRNYPSHNQQNYHQSQHQQEHDNVALPRISDLRSPDNRLLMALGGYDLPSLSLPGSSTPTRNRPSNSHDLMAYLTPQYSSVLSDSIPHPGHHRVNKTPGSPNATPQKGKRPRLVGPTLPEFSSLVVMNTPNGGFYHGQQNQVLQSYAAGVGKLASSLTRKDLEECIIELALWEEDMSATPYNNTAFAAGLKQGLVRNALMSKLSKGNRKIVGFGKDFWSLSMGLSKDGELGNFRRVPCELLIHIISFLPLGTALTFILGVCKSFRALMSEPSLWGRMVVEPNIDTFSSHGFLRFLRSLPETSIRLFGFDTAACEPGALNEAVDLMLKRKHFGLVSIHLSGKKLSLAMVLNALKRLWSENIAVFSLTEVTNSKLDSEAVNKILLPLMPNLRKLRVEGGVWKVKELKILSCIHGQLRNADQNKLVGDNRLTHLSFSGKNTAICWDDLKNFGKWFPELEELFINCIYADEPSWVEKYTIGTVVATEINEALVGIEYATKKYRTLTNEDISWHAMRRLRYFGCDHIGDGANKKHVKVFEDIHAAHIWSLIKGSNRTLQRLEISRGEEYFKYERGARTGSKVYAPLPQLIPVALRNMLPMDFPKLTYLYLGHWKIPWRWFTGFRPVSIIANNSSSSSPAASDASTEEGKEDREVVTNGEQPNLRLSSVKTLVFWRCSGFPTSLTDSGDIPEKKWAVELKEVWGEGLEVLDDSIGLEKALKGNRGGGDW